MHQRIFTILLALLLILSIFLVKPVSPDDEPTITISPNPVNDSSNIQFYHGVTTGASISSSSFTEIKKYEYNTNNSNPMLAVQSYPLWLAQTITVGVDSFNESFYLFTLALNLQSTVSQTLVVHISTLDIDKKPTTNYIANETYDVDTQGAWIWENISISGYLEQGTGYAIVLDGSLQDDVININGTQNGDDSNYGGGDVYYTMDNGATWDTYFGDRDLRFAVYGAQIDVFPSLNMTFLSNSSGTFQSYGIIEAFMNSTYSVFNANFSEELTTYYWYVNVSNSTGDIIYTSDMYHFTTAEDTEAPTLTILFAGNVSDYGGPEFSIITGYAEPPSPPYAIGPYAADGYYTNDSHQQENHIYINVTAQDNSNVSEVWLHWLNGTTWDNSSWQFIHTGDDNWEFDSIGNITDISSGYNYSFDVLAIDSYGNEKLVFWNKTDSGRIDVRRWVQLGCCPTCDTSYKPYYFYDFPYGSLDVAQSDILHHDQGTDGGLTDTGLLLSTIPTNNISNRYCDQFVGYLNSEVCHLQNHEKTL